MPEHPATDLSATDNIGTVKRYAPPNQRNRSLGRRKSGGDRLERANSYASDGEKNQISASSSVSTVADASGVNRANEYPPTRLIPLQGCGTSEAFQLLNDRWAAALNAHNNLPDDSLERPVMYMKRSPWGHAMLPHQLMSQAGAGSSTGPHKDFLNELRLAMLSANAISDA
ncbi:uncharacterized protein LOC107761999 [Nicotiana tabacum]|uniref:Uncharacterized protein LOC107761999 n=2 Tax=Nicotiana TaxID=4085 RepID=A0A1S3X7C6_TOBAC|nr:PREDICTED: uncharacterized protein LOC104241230 [Nicotiana sylvestris]XP_016435786.1 PREDICTED: uncharacterized protein LOC107761999 [Nicotiana tabacum]